MMNRLAVLRLPPAAILVGLLGLPGCETSPTAPTLVVDPVSTSPGTRIPQTTTDEADETQLQALTDRITELQSTADVSAQSEQELDRLRALIAALTSRLSEDAGSGAPPLVLNGTLFVDPDIVTSSDPTTFRSVSYAGRGDRRMYDRRRGAFVTYRAFLFDATFADGFGLEIQVNPEFQTSEASRDEAEKYGRLIGQLPRALRRADLQTLWIHKGVELFGGGNNNVLIHTGQADLYEADGLLEEVFIHEATHTSLDSRHASAPGWIQARQADGDFISAYARDNPSREDLAESFPMWMALRYRRERISARLAATIVTRMPHRLAYLDNQPFNMAPVR